MQCTVDACILGHDAKCILVHWVYVKCCYTILKCCSNYKSRAESGVRVISIVLSMVLKGKII